MLRATPLLLIAFVTTIGGCGQLDIVSRGNAALDPTTTVSASASEQRLTEQAIALDQMTRDLKRKATLQGAAIGAAAGCGLAVVSASSGGQCVAGALAGGAVGAVAGHAAGQKAVEKRVELVSLSRVTPVLAEAKNQMALVNQGLPEMLAAQSAETERLDGQLRSGDITQAQYDARLGKMQAARAELAEVLTLSASQVRAARQALEDAGQKGQTGLDWHVMTAKTLEQDAVSARSQLSLL